jgi:hypothetical protein
MGEERKVYKVLVGKPNNRLLGRLRHNGRMGSEWISGRLVGWLVLDRDSYRLL